MKWHWEKPEVRNRGALLLESSTGSSFTDVLIRTIVNNAGGTVANPTATAALEMASGTIARAFMEAEVQGPDSLANTLTPSVLGMMARELIRNGEYIAFIEVKDGVPMLTPSSYTTVHGSYDPASWTYECNLAGPSGTTTVMVGSERVVHVRYSQDPDRPWKGVGPLQAASLAGRLSAETMEALGDEAGAPRGGSR